MNNRIEAAIERGFERLSAALAMPKEKRLWNADAVAEYFGISKASAYRSVLCKPDFPEPIKIEDGCKRWVSGEVIDWAESHRERRGRRRNGQSSRLASAEAVSL
ncbi:MAG: AlpA family phage regulatory protein [Candidatus Accumulibacter sp.]|jgi:predicted DNA-binding transcriptional regulator AlpA|nr:AlpA family phage regulatory protein [Accumulibacter sp.]